MAEPSATIDEYLDSFPEDVRMVLQKIRRTIHRAVPGAGETISCRIPTITIDGAAVVSFAGWQRHVARYPAPSGDGAYERAIAPYRSAKATLKFPLKDPIPYGPAAQSVALLAAQHGRSTT